MTDENWGFLLEAIRGWGGQLQEDTRERFDEFLTLLGRWNQVSGLTTLRGEQEVVIKHFVDSLAVTPFLTEGFLADVGTGGGFPGVPLAVVNPMIKLVLIEKDSAKCRFLEVVASRLKLDIEILQLRAEEAAKDPSRRYETVCSRALARPDNALTICAPIVAEGGSLIIQAGPSANESLEGLAARASEIGFELEKVDSYSLPLSMGNRIILGLRRVA